MNFNKLDDTNFPDLDTVDVYAFKNDFDYKRFDNAQMTIHICNVPWDMGEAHVGQRTITGIGNVVKFENDNARDEWFSKKKYAQTPEQWATGNFNGFKWVTKYREFHNGDDIKIPLPFDVVSKFNYVWIEYEPAPDEQDPVNYEYGGTLKWFYFIRNFQMLAPNVTSAVCKRDTWQTYINHIQFSGMMLEQGHYPISQISVDEYLSNPLENSSGLLAEDVNFGEIQKVTHSSAIVLNENNMKAVIISSGNPHGNWGTKAANTWNTPNGYKAQDGQPSYYAFAINAGALNSFLTSINNNVPQFIQTIQAVFFISSDLITLGTQFTFAGTTCNLVSAKNSTLDLLTLSKAQFGYSSKYAHLAKLYTYPYSMLEITNENGDIHYIKIEDTNGILKLQTNVNLAYPWINIDGRLQGIGGNVSNTLTFRNVNAHSFNFSGKWYEHLFKWDIPTFAICQSAERVNDYATHFDRIQQANNASVALTNNNALADMSITNAAVTTTGNSAMTARSNTAIDNNTTYDNAMGGYNALVSNNVTRDTTNASIDYEVQSAAIGAASGAVSGAVSAIASGNPAGLINSVVSAGAQIAQTNAAIHLSDTRAQITIDANNSGVRYTTENNRDKALVSKNAATDTTNLSNNVITTRTANDAGVSKANATRDYNNALAAIQNSINSANLGAPYEYGVFANGETANTKPQALIANIVTQSQDAIERTGDYFLRYGYAYNKYIDFNDFNIMPKFSYWKCSDVWVYGLDMADEHMDEIRFFLMGGVTIWRNPEDIGVTSIYENV